MITMAQLGGVLADAGDGHHGWGGGWTWLWGPIMMFAVVGLGAFAFWGMARSARDRPHPFARPSPMTKAREILAERYARGEIETNEYHEKLRDLDVDG